MDTALIVFIIGTVASFLPMYWVALRLLNRQRARAKQMSAPAVAGGVSAGRREFLDLLRQEAAQRAISALQDALDEARYAADRPYDHAHALSARTRQSLLDAGRLVDSLFQRELRNVFRDGMEAMTSATSTPISIRHAVAAASAAIMAFERAIEAGRLASAPEARRPQSLWSTLVSRGRGWVGAGDVSAAA